MTTASPPKDLPAYPEGPGWRDNEASIAAAEAMAADAPTIRARVLRAIAGAWLTGGLTADEAAARLGLTPFTVRPRVTELRIMGAVVDSGLKRANESGLMATVWCAADQAGAARGNAESAENQAAAGSAPPREPLPRDRQNDLAAIHAAQRDLGMDDAVYRELLLRASGHASAADLDDAGRAKVLAELRRLGWGQGK
ncbi:MAG TPA: phage protein GemA/Gp16 family protein [Acidobacteriota bacterium]